ncbi:MAG: anti-sigma regulatory factor [Leptolyngbyaceae bacterium]|nr:anti-sigma regulatory factor [Leptolyngbyaceae bacterium]
MTLINFDGQKVLKKTSLKVNTDPDTSEQLLSWFEEFNHPPLPDITVWWQCQTVLKEGFDNVVEYAHQHLPRETPIEIEVIRFTQAIEIRIWDYGAPFDLAQKLEEVPRLEDNDEDHGRGLRIMQRIADYLSYDRTDDNRNCLLIVKKY